MAGSAGEDMAAAKWQWLPAMYVAGLLLMNIMSIPLGYSEMPEECPEAVSYTHLTLPTKA